MRRYLPLGLLIFITVILAFVLDNFLRDVVLQPLLYALWIGGLILASLHQSVFWGALLLLALVLFVRSLGRGPQVPVTVPEKRYPSQGQVRRWMLLLERAENQRFARWNLAQSLRKLTQDTLSPDDRQGKQRRRVPVEDRLTPEIANYFNAKLPPAQSLGLRQRLQSKTSQPSNPLDLDPEVVVDFLEQETGRLAGD